jgi:hypothetical protein
VSNESTVLNFEGGQQVNKETVISKSLAQYINASHNITELKEWMVKPKNKLF